MSGRKICLWICMECSFKFPRNFSFKNCGGIEPIGSHIRYLPDFCFWNGSVVLATDEASIQGNPLVGQAQSNLWFGDFEELREWGPRSAAGSIYMNDQVKAGQPSTPFLINGFPKRMIHLASDRPVTFTLEIDREGKGIFETYRSIKVDRFTSHIFPGDLDAQWIRVQTDKTCTASVSFHFSDDEFRNSSSGENLFGSIAEHDDGNVSAALLFP